MVVNIAGQNQVQVVQNGQSSILHVNVSPQGEAEIGFGQDARIEHYSLPGGQSMLDGLVFSMPEAPVLWGETGCITLQPARQCPFPLKVPGIRFKTERLPISTEDLLDCIGATVAIGDKEVTAGSRAKTTVVRARKNLHPCRFRHGLSGTAVRC